MGEYDGDIHLPLGLARRLRAKEGGRGVSVGRYVGDLLRVAPPAYTRWEDVPA